MTPEVSQVRAPQGSTGDPDADPQTSEDGKRCTQPLGKNKHEKLEMNRAKKHLMLYIGQSSVK